MSERLTNQEAEQQHERPAEQHETTHQPEVDHAALEKAQAEKAEASRTAAEEHATPGRLLAVEKEEPKSGYLATHHLLKKDSYKSLLKQTRQQLPKTAQAFSKVVHQKNIEAISNVGAQTVARPSGLLGGGLGALAGSLTLLYYAKHYGFRYNYAFFLFTFIAGFGIGLVVEIILRVFRRSTNN